MVAQPRPDSNAAKEARGYLLRAAAQKFNVAPEDLEVRSGRIQLKGAPEQGVNVAQLSAELQAKEGGLAFLGRFVPPSPPPFDRTRLENHGMGSFLNPSFACHACTVEVDRETGNVRVLRYVAAHDVGTVINPIGAEGQVEGGVAQSIGYALSEGYLWDEKGRLLTDSFGTYLLPTAVDVPMIEAILVESHPGQGTYGAKGIGEPAVSPVLGAIANAVYDATGVRIKETPITPERVRRALREKEQGQGAPS